MASGPTFRTELSRKLFHLSSAAIAIAYVLADRTFMLWGLAICLGIAVVVEALRYLHPGFRALFARSVGFMVRDAEWGRLTGSTYVLLGALLSVAIFPSKNVVIGVLLVLSISDSAASLIGIRYGRIRFLGKSLEGSLAFFVTALIILGLALPATPVVALIAAFVATVVEALPSLKLGRLELNDNVMVPLLTGAIIYGTCALVRSTGTSEQIAALLPSGPATP
jgi:dolichol kinase